MTTFKGKNGAEWQVELDAPLVEEIRDKHGVNLTDLERDPLLKMRNDPMTLVAVIYLLCQDQVEKENLTPTEFGKQLPSPSDAMLEAVAEAIVNFSPTGRHSHVREALKKFAEMSTISDEIALKKMADLLPDIKTKMATEADSERFKTELERQMDAHLAKMYPNVSELGT